MIRRAQQAADRRADQRDGVLGGHRIVDRGGVQHPPAADQSRLAGHLDRPVEDPVRTIGGGQAGAHVHQHRVHEPRVVEVEPAGGVLPSHIEGEPIHRLPIRQPFQPLQHHHHRHDHRWH